MFIGHFAVGMAGKRVATRVSLPVLFLAAQFADTLWPILVAAGIETVRIVPGDRNIPFEFVSYPWSHSLLMLIVWGVLFGLVYRAYTGDGRGGILVGGLVVSHWVLDFITHRPDMPLYPGGPKFGLALWDHPTASVVVEVIVFAIGVAIYEGMTKGKDKKGQYSFWLMILLFLVAFAASMGGAPPSIKALWSTALVAIGAGLLLSAYVDRHRTLEDSVHAD
ncbi:MAG: metal-dependent hydrolase [Gemmatimonadaceae bacterium]